MGNFTALDSVWWKLGVSKGQFSPLSSRSGEWDGSGPLCPPLPPFPMPHSSMEAEDWGLAPVAESLFCLLSLKTETCFSFYALLKKNNLKGHYSCWIGCEQGYPAEILIIQAIMKLIQFWQICRAALRSSGNTVDNYFVREGSWGNVRMWGCIFFTYLKPYFHYLCLHMPCLHIYECVPWPAKSLPSSVPEMLFFCRSFLFGNFTGNDGLV